MIEGSSKHTSIGKPNDYLRAAPQSLRREIDREDAISIPQLVLNAFQQWDVGGLAWWRRRLAPHNKFGKTPTDTLQYRGARIRRRRSLTDDISSFKDWLSGQGGGGNSHKIVATVMI
jgi:hypothetical protein